jgi:hypothetical protein
MKETDSGNYFFKKAKTALFNGVDWDFKETKTIGLVFFCALVFEISFFAGIGIMNHDKKPAQILSLKNVLAADNQEDGNLSNAQIQENIFLAGENASATMQEAAGSVKKKAASVRQARKAARERAAFAAFIRSGPEPTGPTSRLSDGRRVCGKKNDKPQRGGRVHVDEDCCPDYNETPNPRCYYTPGQLGILK